MDLSQQDVYHSGSQLKRVVVTSSTASVIDSNSSGTLNENNWNEAGVELVRQKGSAAPAGDKYRASKALAEKGMLLCLDIDKEFY